MNSVVRCKSFVSIFAIMVFFAFLFSLIPISAQEEESTESTGMSIKRIVICSSVVEREPVGEGESFSVDIKKVFCFTDVRNAGEETFITHEWYYIDELKATVKLKVTGEHWRTWSSKGIDKNWTGEWRVEVKDSDGNLLRKISFNIGEKAVSTEVIEKDESEDADSKEEEKDSEGDNKDSKD